MTKSNKRLTRTAGCLLLLQTHIQSHTHPELGTVPKISFGIWYFGIFPSNFQYQYFVRNFKRSVFGVQYWYFSIRYFFYLADFYKFLQIFYKFLQILTNFQKIIFQNTNTESRRDHFRYSVFGIIFKRLVFQYSV